MADEPTRAEIEKATEAARGYIEYVERTALENAHEIQGHGYVTARSLGQQLHSRGAPSQHPVWSDALREEIRQERRQGIETGPLQEVERDFKKYPPAWTAPVPDGWTNLPRAWGQGEVNQRQGQEGYRLAAQRKRVQEQGQELDNGYGY